MTTTFELLDRDAAGRIGRLKVGKKVLDTPNIFIVVSPRENIISPREMQQEFGTQALFTNSYIIYKNADLRAELERKKIHEWLGFDGLVATDSGAFQHYMYEDDLEVTPAEIEGFQEKIGSDCPVILDIPVQLTDSYAQAKEKVDITLQRARENVAQRTLEDKCWFGPLHGTMYLDLVRHSAIEMSKLDFGIYAIGGVVKTFINYDFPLDVDILCTAKAHLTEGRPLHMFGLGLPQFFALAVACGCDTMDSAAYALYAKENRYFTLEGTKKLENLTEFPCMCPTCAKVTPQEVLTMTAAERVKTLARHNLYITFQELRTVRQALKEGNLWELAERRARSHPRLLDAIHHLQKHQPYLEEKDRALSRRGLIYVGLESGRRPIIQRTSERLLSRYSPPVQKRVAIVLPEVDVSAIGSPAIKEWADAALHGSKERRDLVHIIYANPLFGAIPREVAHVYPLSQTSFPVYWSGAEMEMAAGKLQAYFQTFPQYERVFLFRPEEYQNENGDMRSLDQHAIDFFSEGARTDATLQDKVQLFTSLDELRQALGDYTEHLPFPGHGGEG